MPEPTNSTALVPIESEYLLNISEFDAAGKKNQFAIAVPKEVNSVGISPMLQAAILKTTTWKSFPFPVVLHAVIYAERMGLDIMAGDVYTADGGRLATTAGAKIRHAMASGKIAGYSVDITEGPEITLKGTTAKGPWEWTGPNLKAKVTVEVSGWTKPMVYETTLEEWFMGSNPNWRSRPSYMLRRNALSKALDEVTPMGVDPDEAPPASIG